MKIWFDPSFNAPLDFDAQCKTAKEALELLRTGKVEYLSIGCSDMMKITEALSLAVIIESLSATGDLPPITWEIHTRPVTRLAAVIEIMRNADCHWHRLFSHNTGLAVTQSGRLIVYPTDKN